MDVLYELKPMAEASGMGELSYKFKGNKIEESKRDKYINTSESNPTILKNITPSKNMRENVENIRNALSDHYEEELKITYEDEEKEEKVYFIKKELIRYSIRLINQDPKKEIIVKYDIEKGLVIESKDIPIDIKKSLLEQTKQNLEELTKIEESPKQR